MIVQVIEIPHLMTLFIMYLSNMFAPFVPENDHSRYLWTTREGLIFHTPTHMVIDETGQEHWLVMELRDGLLVPVYELFTQCPYVAYIMFRNHIQGLPSFRVVHGNLQLPNSTQQPRSVSFADQAQPDGEWNLPLPFDPSNPESFYWWLREKYPDAPDASLMSE